MEMNFKEFLRFFTSPSYTKKEITLEDKLITIINLVTLSILMWVGWYFGLGCVLHKFGISINDKVNFLGITTSIDPRNQLYDTGSFLFASMVQSTIFFGWLEKEQEDRDSSLIFSLGLFVFIAVFSDINSLTSIACCIICLLLWSTYIISSNQLIPVELNLNFFIAIAVLLNTLKTTQALCDGSFDSLPIVALFWVPMIFESAIFLYIRLVFNSIYTALGIFWGQTIKVFTVATFWYVREYPENVLGNIVIISFTLVFMISTVFLIEFLVT